MPARKAAQANLLGPCGRQTQENEDAQAPELQSKNMIRGLKPEMFTDSKRPSLQTCNMVKACKFHTL